MARFTKPVGVAAINDALFEHLEARQFLTVIGWDGGGDGTTLTDPANWTGDVLPGPTDDATINVAGTPTITMSGGAFSVHSLSCSEAFTQTAGTLTLDGASFFAGGLTMSGGVMTGAGGVSVTSAFNWGAGTLAGAGITTIGNGIVMTMNSPGTRVLSRNLVNAGRINHSDGVLQFGGGGTLSNAVGRVYNLSGTGTFDATGSGNTFANAGVFNDQTTAAITLNVVFNSSGQVNVYGGVLNIDGGGTNSGTRNIASGAILDYRASYTHAAGSNSAGSGILNFNGGTQTISGNWTSTSYVQLLSGTLDGSGDLTTAGPFIWGGGTMTGSGNITTTLGGKLALTTGGAHILSRAIVNNGNLHFLNGTLTMAGATITNEATGTFAVLPTATISASAGINVIDNAGLFKKMGPGTITLDSVSGGIRMNNTGMVDVRNGVLNLNGPISQLTGGSLSGGTWQIYPTATLSMGSTAIDTLGANTTINMVGGGASFGNISALATNNGTINFSLGGIYEFTPAGGTFTNNGTIDLTQDRWFRVDGNFVQSTSGIMNFDLLSDTRFSRVIVTGTSTLAGTVAFEYIAGFMPAQGMIFSFFQDPSRTGTFNSATIPPSTGGTGVVAYTVSGVSLVFG